MNFLPDFNGVRMIAPIPSLQQAIYVDACTTAGGGHFSNHAFHIQFLSYLAPFPIHQLEMLTALMAIKQWAPLLQGHICLLYSDNSAAVSVLQTGRG